MSNDGRRRRLVLPEDPAVREEERMIARMPTQFVDAACLCMLDGIAYLGDADASVISSDAGGG